MKSILTIAALALTVLAAEARADGDAHCKSDDAVTIKCICAQNGQRFVAESKCLDQTGRNFLQNKRAFTAACQKKNNRTTSCEVLE